MGVTDACEKYHVLKGAEIYIYIYTYLPTGGVWEP